MGKVNEAVAVELEKVSLSRNPKKRNRAFLGDTTGQAFGGINYAKLVDDFFDAGYAGTLGWAVTTGSADVAAVGWSTSRRTSRRGPMLTRAIRTIK